MAFASVASEEPMMALNGEESNMSPSEDEHEHGGVFMTPRTPLGGRRSRFRPVYAGVLTVAGLALVLLMSARHQQNNRSTLRGVVGLDDDAIKDTQLDITIRDFKKSSLPGGHGDMYPDPDLVHRGVATGLVADELGEDGKPVFVGKTVDEGVTKGLTTKANFDQWYNDVDGVNKKVLDKIQMRVKENGQLVYENHAFFPVDGKGWKDSENETECAKMHLHGCNDHNYYFTLEMHKEFTYHGGEVFTFKGDDDLWVFINKKLVVDLGGMHQELEESIKLDDLDLEPNSINQFHLFFAERHPSDSNFRVETSIRLDQVVAVKGQAEDEGKCCLIYTSFFAIVCSPTEDKQWYHFMCTE